MALISLMQANLSFSDRIILQDSELHIEAHERICLVGRNGAGKSTLLKVLNRDIALDDGKLIYQQNLVVSYLQQDPPQSINATLFDYVAAGLSDYTTDFARYQALLAETAVNPTTQNLRELADMDALLSHKEAWQATAHIKKILNALSLNAEATLSSLSGGWLRRVALARALVCSPQVLLLDEPTNHLDINTIMWLEKFLQNFAGSIVFVSHDRAFIQAMATKIVDLDRGSLRSWPGNYHHYLEKKSEALAVEITQQQLFDKKLAQEEAWLRQGVKARRTRNEGRVRALHSLRNERKQRLSQIGAAKMSIAQHARSGQLVFEIEALSYQIEGKLLVKAFTQRVLRGDKIALVGPNGCGKTTLIKLLLDQLSPDSGSVKCGTKLEIAYFDQHRAQLDLSLNLIENLTGGSQDILINGRPRHVIGYLQDFLFHPKQIMSAVKTLSGGERNRLLLAKLFLMPSNLLILDEPTNDLDIETLELLEQLIFNYAGTVLIISHDRQFIENVATESWFFNGEGEINHFIGHCSAADIAQKYLPNPINRTNNGIKANKKNISSAAVISSTLPEKAAHISITKLSYQLQRELDALPKKIEMLEAKLLTLEKQMNDADFFAQAYEKKAPILQAYRQTEEQIKQNYQRWQALEKQQQGK